VDKHETTVLQSIINVIGLISEVDPIVGQFDSKV